MPAKNSVKLFIANGTYHIYNRGVEKRVIFLDEQDYAVFIAYLKEYLLPKDLDGLQKIILDNQSDSCEKDKARKLLRLNNFFGRFEVIAYCLMPNHFHLLVRQQEEDAMDCFMNSLCTRYSLYFNRKYKRVGPLFQGPYKAVLVETDEQMLHLSRYIHRNPINLLQGNALQTYPHSSYPEYLGLRQAAWISSELVLSMFSGQNALIYKSFVESVEDFSAPGLPQTLLDEGFE